MTTDLENEVGHPLDSTQEEPEATVVNGINRRTVLALRELADQLERSELSIGATINTALSTITTGHTDADRLLVLILSRAADHTNAR